MKEKIKKIAELLGEPIWRIKEALGIDDNKTYSSLSINELKIAFRDADPDSEEEYFIQKEFERRLGTEISSGIFNRIRDAYFLALELELEKSKLEAFQAWDELAIREVEKAVSYEDLKIACDRAPKSGRARILARQKKEAILMKALDQARTIGEYVDIFKKAPAGSKIRSLAAKNIYDRLSD